LTQIQDNLQEIIMVHFSILGAIAFLAAEAAAHGAVTAYNIAAKD
jgi:hypothetical protein